jgi:hypothetical protein
MSEIKFFLKHGTIFKSVIRSKTTLNLAKYISFSGSFLSTKVYKTVALFRLAAAAEFCYQPPPPEKSSAKPN